MTADRAHTLQHELRTPVNHLVGYAELILEEPDLPAELSGALASLRALAHQSLTDIASIATSSGDPQPGPLDSLASTLAGMEAAVSAAVAAAPDSVAADVGRLQSACEHLRSLVRDLAGSSLTTAAPAPPPLPEPAAPTVLVVDDDPANRDVLSRRLSRLGYNVLEAPDGAQALATLRAEPIDLVLLDLVMPVVDGFAVLEQRQHHEDLRDVPVIMISAMDQVESVVRCIELGAEDYLTKPFDPVLLKARVGASIERKQLHDREKQLLATVNEQAQRLREMNRDLEERVAQKVSEVERLSLMQRFVPPQLAELLVAGGTEFLQSHRREIAVLFCDLRGFTPFAETSEPEDVMSVLGDLHNAVGPLIFEYGGTLAQFTGDGMMVFFNDPIPCEDPAWRAVQLALGMRERAASLSEAWRALGHDLQVGVGVAMGFATCGQIGFEGRYEYTAIGTVTNLAARLCGQASGGQILLNERVRTLVGPRVTTTHIGDLPLRGFARPVPAYSITPA